MVSVRCDDIDPIYWSWVVEYAKKKRIERCKALEMIIKDHMRFTKMAYDKAIAEGSLGTKKKK